MTPKPILHCRIASCSRHTATCIPHADVGLPCVSSLNALRPRGMGVSQRIEYGSVSCVSPVASCCCRAGVVFGGNRRFSHSGFGKISPRRRAARSRTARSRASLQPPCQAASHSSPLSARRTRVALGAWRRANASARLCRHQCQHCLGCCSAQPGHSAVRLIRCRRRGAPLHRRQSHRPRQPVVRAIHEHGSAAVRSSRHRLGHGAVHSPATASACPARRSAPLR